MIGRLLAAVRCCHFNLDRVSGCAACRQGHLHLYAVQVFCCRDAACGFRNAEHRLRRGRAGAAGGGGVEVESDRRAWCAGVACDVNDRARNAVVAVAGELRDGDRGLAAGNVRRRGLVGDGAGAAGRGGHGQLDGVSRQGSGGQGHLHLYAVQVFCCRDAACGFRNAEHRLRRGRAGAAGGGGVDGESQYIAQAAGIACSISLGGA